MSQNSSRKRWHVRFGEALRATAATLALAAACAVAPPARAGEFNNTVPRGTFAGNHNYVATGGTLRAASNDSNACSLVGGGNGSSGTSTAALSGIPAGATIEAAYLYWGGSGPTVDSQVTFGRQGSTTSITADQTFTETFVLSGSYNLAFFGGFKDVTSLVTGNGNYTFGGLAVAYQDNIGNAQGDYCTSQTVLSAWGLIVVYSHPSERYRFTRVYDGLKFFRGSSVTTTQSGFRVPDLVDGKVTVLTWEGDPDATTSTELDGFNEALSFEGHALFNSACDATNNLYNSTLKAPGGTCNANNYGADLDTYDVTAFLYEGQTGAVLDYSSGNDLVLLAAQVISTTNTPVADLGITKTHNGSYFTAGQTGSYNIVVHNHGPEIAVGTATVTDTLPTGLTFVSGTGTGWTCSAVGQVVTCNNSAPSIAVDADLPTLVLTVAVDGTAAASTDNTAEVSHPMFDGTGGNQTSTDTVTVRRSDLSGSTKTVLDVNGGDLTAGDVLRYTITLNAASGANLIDATDVTVVDDLPANVGNLQVISIPSGATDNSVGSGGANGTGQVNIGNITVPAGQSRTIVFEVTVAPDAAPGDEINNTAVITTPSGTGATPSANLTIPDPAPPTPGNKVLYVYDMQSAPTQSLSRKPQPANTTGTNYVIVARNSNQTWSLSPSVAPDRPLVIPAQQIAVYLFTRAGNASTGSNRPTTVTLLNGDTPIATSGSINVGGTTTTRRTWLVNLTQPVTIAPGSQLRLRFNNNATQNNREVWVYGRPSGTGANVCLTLTNCSKVVFEADTVVNVDSVSFHTAAYPAETTKDDWEPGDVVRIRAIVSDPFGGFDVNSAALTLRNAANTIVLNNAAMTAKTNPAEGANTALRVFEYDYTVPAGSYGTWTATVTATEGQETPAVTHTRPGTFNVVPKSLSVVKSHSGDFTAGANNTYTLTVTNNDSSTITGTTTVKDTLPAGLTYVSGTGTGWTCGAVGQVVTCTSTASVGPGASMAPITLTVFVAGNMGSSVQNQAYVGNSTIAGGLLKPGNTDTAIIRHPDLSTSTKTVADLDGGDANPNDTLRYTITVIESAGYPANDVTVTDVFPASLTGLSGLNASLSTCNGTPSVNGNTLTVTGLSLAGGASCTLVVDVQVSASAGAGLTIDNTATIDNPNGPGATPSAPTVTVSQSQVVIPGGKVLYVYANNTMSRVPQTTTGTNTINENAYQEFILGGVANPLTIAPGSDIAVSLWLQRSGNTTTTARSVYVKLFKNGTTQIGPQSNTVNFTSTTLALQNFTIPVPEFGTAGSLQPGDTLVLRVYNDSGTGGNPRTVGFAQRNGTVNSTVTILTPTVVHVDSVDIRSAPYPSEAQASSYGAGETIYIRATVSDPFGFADISGGSIAIKDPSGTTVATANLVNGTHTKSTSGAIRIYEYAYTIPAGPPTGAWTASVTANEGTEGTITHTGSGGFSVGGKVTLTKAWGPGANPGDAVSLTISGGTGAVAGSSTAPSTTTPATANAATGATITLTEAFTSGTSANYTVTLACVKDSDGTTVTPVGTGLSRTITMPAGSVTCTWTNSKTVPLGVMKVATILSDPVNGSSHPKAIPGAIVEYQVIVTNPAGNAADAGTVVVVDKVPDNLKLVVADINGPGSGPVQFIDGSPSSGLSYTPASDIAYAASEDGSGNPVWGYTPSAGGDGTDPAVMYIKVNPQGAFSGNNGQFTLKFRMRIE